MNTAEAQRLLEEQTAAIELTEQRAEQLTKYKEDYEVLHKRLQTLPDKITHDVMVPFGKLAFMPGQLIHTNEVLVLLGDNWFVERSAKQACGIIDRRVDVINKQLEELEQQKGLLEPRRQFTEELWGVNQEKHGAFEIREEYNEQMEKQWKEKHKENMKKYREELKKERNQTEIKQQQDPLTEAELWARLDELEDQELQDHEMEKLEEELQNEESPSDQGASHSARSDENQRSHQIPMNIDTEDKRDDDYDDTEDSYDDEDDDSDDYDEEEEESTPPARPTSIRFSHTKTDSPQVSLGNASTNPDGTLVITSPADIYSHFMSAGPRSILRSPGQSSSNGKQRVTIKEPEETDKISVQESVQEKPQPLPGSKMAFTGSIVEREDPTLAEPPLPSTPAIPMEPTAPQPRISKFKAQRMRQQNR